MTCSFSSLLRPAEIEHVLCVCCLPNLRNDHDTRAILLTPDYLIMIHQSCRACMQLHPSMQKNNPKLRTSGTHIPAHMVTAHIHWKTPSHSCTEPLSQYSISCTCAHTFTLNYMSSYALTQEETHKHPAASSQVFYRVYVCLYPHVWKQWRWRQQWLFSEYLQWAATRPWCHSANRKPLNQKKMFILWRIIYLESEQCECRDGCVCGSVGPLINLVQTISITIKWISMKLKQHHAPQRMNHCGVDEPLFPQRHL